MNTIHFLARLSAAGAMAGCIALVACTHESPAARSASSSSATPAQPGVTSMQPGESRSATSDETPYIGSEATAADRLATARCDHESQCQHLGTGRRFTTVDDCVSRVRADMKAELDRYGCRGALDSVGIGQCMSTLIDESCQQSLDDLTHSPQCRSEAVCMAPR